MGPILQQEWHMEAGIKPRRFSSVSCGSHPTLHIYKVPEPFTTYSTMQFFKSIVVSILAFSAYTNAATLPEPRDCLKLFDICSPEVDRCCPGLYCVYLNPRPAVSLDLVWI